MVSRRPPTSLAIRLPPDQAAENTVRVMTTEHPRATQTIKCHRPQGDFGHAWGWEIVSGGGEVG